MKIRRLLKMIYFFGFKYKCIYCSFSYRKFDFSGLSHDVLKRLDVIGGQQRDNSKCPICKSTDRERLLFFYYKKLIKPVSESKSMKILHIAPEKNLRNVLIKDQNIEYYSGDKFEEGYEYPDECAYLDITNLNYPNEVFDFVICNHVLEHVSDYNIALSEIRRVLKIGGKGILQVPLASKVERTIEDDNINTESLREYHYGQKDHVRLFGMDYPAILAKAGFTVDIYSPQYLSNDQVDKYRLNSRENLFQVTK